ncbi:MAG: DUF4878 domain-containing protein [Prevotellaceae bacterium]|nr:DUF4878 domain-containing protein [Prevotellaceae bacterium]
MKKLLGMVALVAFALLITACGNSNTPKGVAEKSIKCIQKGDYEGYVDLMYVSKESKNIEEEKKGYASLLQSKAGPALEEKGGIKSYEILSEEISEDGNSAKVDIKVVYGNGEEKNQTIQLLKDKNDDWKLDSNK